MDRSVRERDGSEGILFSRAYSDDWVRKPTPYRAASAERGGRDRKKDPQTQRGEDVFPGVGNGDERVLDGCDSNYEGETRDGATGQDMKRN